MRSDLFYFKKAFTLAEVLITLGIIGIVAAMTIPNLVQNPFKNQYLSIVIFVKLLNGKDSELSSK